MTSTTVMFFNPQSKRDTTRCAVREPLSEIEAREEMLKIKAGNHWGVSVYQILHMKSLFLRVAICSH